MSTTLILGAGGFLGGHLARHLVGRGERVRLFDLAIRPLPAMPNGTVEYMEGNFLNPGDLARALKGADRVLHFISTTVPASSADNPMVEIETNVAATTRLLTLMAEMGVGFIGFPSSGGTVYGESDRPHAEDEPLAPTCPYGLGKALIEQTIRYFRDWKGIRYQIWRIANPFGDPSKLHLDQGVVDAFLHRARLGKPLSLWGDGSQVRDFVYIDDVVDAVAGLLDRGITDEVVNIGSGRGVSVRRVAEAVGRLTGQDLHVEPAPRYAGIRYFVLNVDKITRLTGWRPRRDFETGLALAWDRLTRGDSRDC